MFRELTQLPKMLWVYKGEWTGIALGAVAFKLLGDRFQQFVSGKLPDWAVTPAASAGLGTLIFFLSEVFGGVLRQFQPVARFAGIGLVGMGLGDLLNKKLVPMMK